MIPRIMDRMIMRDQHKQQRNTGKTYITCNQRKQLIKEVGDSGALLYIHYYDKGAYQGFNIMDDTAVAKEIGWPVRKVQRERIKLTKAGWIFKRTITGTTDKFHITIIGKEAVSYYIQQHMPDVIKDTDTSIDIMKRMKELHAENKALLFIQGEHDSLKSD